MEIVLLVRSYNRPEYLEKTLESVLKSDINLCIKRYIYDDGSNNTDTINILNNETYVNCPSKEFEVIFNDKNVKCKKSFIDALTFLKEKHSSNCLICLIDNDVNVKYNFISQIITKYMEAYKFYNHNKILFTGFNSSNTHKNNKNYEENREFEDFYRKTSMGGVNFIFHNTFIDEIISAWSTRVDWGVVKYMNRKNYPMLCFKNSILNHIGENGLWSRKGRYDHDKDFEND
jgi:hypothetical protein